MRKGLNSGLIKGDLCTLAYLPLLLPANVFILAGVAIWECPEEPCTLSGGLVAMIHHRQCAARLHEGHLAIHAPFDTQEALIQPFGTTVSHDALGHGLEPRCSVQWHNVAHTGALSQPELVIWGTCCPWVCPLLQARCPSMPEDAPPF